MYARATSTSRFFFSLLFVLCVKYFQFCNNTVCMLLIVTTLILINKCFTVKLLKCTPCAKLITLTGYGPKALSALKTEKKIKVRTFSKVSFLSYMMGNETDDLKLPALSKATYQRWSFEVKFCARSLGVLSIVDGSEVRPSGQNREKEVMEWDKRDGKACRILTCGLSDDDHTAI